MRHRIPLLGLIPVLLAVLSFPANFAFAAPLEYPHETQITLSGSGIKLKILRGSQADRVTKDENTVTVELSSGQAFRIRYPGPNPGKMANDHGLKDCNIVDDGDNELALVGPGTVKITPGTTLCLPETAAGQAGTIGPVESSEKAYVKLFSPDGGEVLVPGTKTLVLWTANQPDGFAKIVISLSIDNKETFAVIGEKGTNDGFFDWTVPDEGSLFAYIKVEVLNASGNVLASDMSRDRFIIAGSTLDIDGETIALSDEQLAPTRDIHGIEAEAPITDPNMAGAYDPDAAVIDTPTVNVDLSLETVQDEHLHCVHGTVFKGKGDTVYYCARNGHRYVFPNRKTYISWFDDFSHVITFSDEHIAQIPIGGNVTYKPGTRLVKIETDPKVYAVARGGTLRHVSDESVAERVFGKDWAKQVDDISDALFTDYTIGEDIE